MNRKNRRRFRRASLPEISLTPLIDTALTLLIIFMITAPMINNSIKIDLPQGETQEVNDEQDMVISMAKSGAIYFNDEPIDRSQLVSVVKSKRKENDSRPVYVKADTALEYGTVIELVDELKQAHVAFVALSIEQKTAANNL